MTTRDSRSLQDIFDLLDRWRHLPFYRLEPQIAPFFALFLRDILYCRFDVELHPIIIPEFPLRLGTLCLPDRHTNASDNRSFKVDYVAFSVDLTRAFFVELKTDDGSMNIKQEEYLCEASCKDFNDLVCGVINICNGSDRKQKYVHLLHLLSKIGLVRTDEDLYCKSFREFADGSTKAVAGWTKALSLTKCTMVDQHIETEVVYIKPTHGRAEKEGLRKNFKYIDFRFVADSIREQSELGRMFANCLDNWASKAGSADPRSPSALCSR